MDVGSFINIRELDVYYGSFHAIRDVSLAAPPRAVTALIGASGSGKSTLLRAINRMHDFTPSARVTGSVIVDETDVYSVDPVLVRQRVGMVFQRPNPFRASIFDNVAYGIRIRYLPDGASIHERVEKSLRAAALWDEVKDRLREPGLALSGGQQQRLCIARAIAAEPQVILMDEPTSALDPISTARIEELIGSLREHYCVVIVTHSMRQAARISDRTAFLHLGDVIEVGPTVDIFSHPRQRQTEEYIAGRSDRDIP